MAPVQPTSCCRCHHPSAAPYRRRRPLPGNTWADQVEVAFPGGVARQCIIGVCPADKKTKVEIMSDRENNPYYEPWH